MAGQHNPFTGLWFGARRTWYAGLLQGGRQQVQRLPRGRGYMSALVLSLVTLGSFCRAEDWPQWRGPDRTDISRETGLQTRWPEEGPRRLWMTRDAGIGYSGPAIVQGRLYILGARDGTSQLLCYDAQEGTQLWSADVGQMLTNGWGDGPRGTPTIDQGLVFALGGRGDLICADAADGRVIWRTRMQDYGGSIPNWGYTESVLVDGDQVVCTPGGNQGTILALDRKTGKKIWQSSDFIDGAQYASLIRADHQGTPQYIQLTQKSVAAVDVATGELLWRTDWPGRTAVIPTPIYHDGHVYVTSGYGVGCNLYRVSDDSRTVEEVYDDQVKKVMKNHHGGVLLFGDHLYGYSDGVGWTCQRFDTGERVWRERSKLGKGSLTCAQGQLYCLSEDEGDVVLLDATAEGWTERGRFRLEPQSQLRKPRGRIWTHPVVANGRLFLRDQELLFCFDVRQQ